MSTSKDLDPALFDLPDLSAGMTSHAPSPSPPRVDDSEPTPMPQLDTASYFAPLSPPPPSPNPIDMLCNILDSIPIVQTASTAKFLAWRPARSLESSITSSASPVSSSFEGNVMPTVARAQGGGEWEASLSRRIAKQHQRRQRRHVERRPCGKPLFPTSSGSVGLSDLVENAFKPLRAAWAGNKGWRRAAVVCAVAMAVGWGCWAARSR